MRERSGKVSWKDGTNPDIGQAAIIRTFAVNNNMTVATAGDQPRPCVE